MNECKRVVRLGIAVLILTGFIVAARAQEVSIPDAGLNAAIRQALQRPSGPLTEQDLLTLTNLNASDRNISSVEGLEAARNLIGLDLDSNALTNFALRADVTNLFIALFFSNPLTNFTLPATLNRLSYLDLSFDRLRGLALPTGLTNLSRLFLSGNQLTNLTLTPGLAELTALFVDNNPLATFVLSEPSAATNLADTVAMLRNQGVSVFTYPLAVELVRPLMFIGAFKFGITGPPGDYTVLASTNLTDWREVGIASNPLGGVNFVDTTAQLASHKFYRIRPTTLP